MRIAFTGGTIYVSPDEAPIRNGAVLVEDAKFAAVGASEAAASWNADEVLDCSDCTVMAGFWNSHVHFFERKWADARSIPADELEGQLRETFVRFGFTTVFDTGSQWHNTRAIRERIDCGEVAGPRVYSTGEALLPPGALPPAQVLAALGYVSFAVPEIRDAAQARRAAENLIDAGADGIKIFPSSPRSGPMPPDAVAAAAQVARSVGKPAFAHPDTNADVLTAIRAGVDVIAHTTARSGPWEEPLLGEMRRRAVAVTPTLALWSTMMQHDRLSVRERYVNVAVDQLRAWHAAGGLMLFGTDLGATGADPGTEYSLLSAAGMRFTDILASLTTAPARHFNVRGAGRIVRGCDADVVVVHGDPAKDLRVLRDVRYVMRSGRILYTRSGR